MKNKKSNLLKEIGIAVTATIIGLPLGIGLIQPYCYYDIKDRIARMERENPTIAQEFAETLVKPNKNIIIDLASYGTQKAAREYLNRENYGTDIGKQ